MVIKINNPIDAQNVIMGDGRRLNEYVPIKRSFVRLPLWGFGYKDGYIYTTYIYPMVMSNPDINIITVSIDGSSRSYAAEIKEKTNDYIMFKIGLSDATSTGASAGVAYPCRLTFDIIEKVVD